MHKYNKIYYIHGTMYSGKSLDLISTYFTYKFNNKKVLVLKHAKDTRDIGIIKSRMSSQEIECTTFTDEESLYSTAVKQLRAKRYHPDVILIDEVQFCNDDHIKQLQNLSTIAPVMCYGLKTSYTGDLFPAIAKLIPLAESVKEIKTTCCMCNSKATHNLLVRNGKPIYEGAFVNIEGVNHDDKYHAVCREHFYNPVLTELKNNIYLLDGEI